MQVLDADMQTKPAFLQNVVPYFFEFKDGARDAYVWCSSPPVSLSLHRPLSSVSKCCNCGACTLSNSLLLGCRNDVGLVQTPQSFSELLFYRLAHPFPHTTSPESVDVRGI